VVLFYIYARLGPDQVKAAAEEQRRLGPALRLCGRVLVAAEGVNGTVQGSDEAISSYQAATEAAVGSSIDWKRSRAGEAALFPDFAVKEVAELVGFGLQPDGRGPLAVEEAGPHLSPAAFHRLLGETPPDQLRLIDVRNSFEYQVGHFDGAIDPGMSQTAEWPHFVKRNLEDLRGRRVLLYCTGGIRCEKASAYLCRRLRETAPEARHTGGGGGDRPPEVYQLGGGIHRYLEEFPDGGKFRGANFVFDRRQQMRADGTIVGRCSECAAPWDGHHGGRVCCVCRVLVLVCDSCDSTSVHGEYYCGRHEELRGIYHHFIDRFGAEELERQAGELRARLDGEVGVGGKNRRATLRKKMEQAEARARLLRAAGRGSEAGHSHQSELTIDGCGTTATSQIPLRRCRACEKPYAECPGSCWGFWREPHRWADVPQATGSTHEESERT